MLTISIEEDKEEIKAVNAVALPSFQYEQQLLQQASEQQPAPMPVIVPSPTSAATLYSMYRPYYDPLGFYQIPWLPTGLGTGWEPPFPFLPFNIQHHNI